MIWLWLCGDYGIDYAWCYGAVMLCAMVLMRTDSILGTPRLYKASCRTRKIIRKVQ